MLDSPSQIKPGANNPKRAIRFANMVLILGVAFWLCVVIYAAYRYYVPIYDFTWGNDEQRKIYFDFILVGTAFLIFFVFGLRLKDRLKVNLSLVIAALAVSLYSLETYLVFSLDEPRTQEQFAEKMGIPYDTRTYIEVLQDLREDGVKAFPNIVPGYLSESNGLEGESGRIYPLGGIANITTIFTNEGGFFPLIETDELGFNNPRGLYGKGKLDAVLTGDSFTEGWSVQSEESISSQLRELGVNAFSLGKAGNGPITEYAALKEYAEPIQPKIVIWLYYVNDFLDLNRETQSPLMMKYYDDENFSQNLLSRQKEIEKVLIKYSDEEWMTEEKKLNQKEERDRIEFAANPFIIISKLTNVRRLINLTSIRKQLTPEVSKADLFPQIMERSKRLVSRWGGKLYFVYLPSLNFYKEKKDDAYREFVLSTVGKLEIPIIDAQEEVFARHSRPLSLFPFESNFHYTAEGYRLIAEVIAGKLKEDGIIPSNSDN